MRAHVLMDGTRVGALRIGGELKVPAAAGMRLIRVEGRGLGGLTIESGWLKVRLEPGEVANVRIFIQKRLMKNAFALERVAPPRHSSGSTKEILIS